MERERESKRAGSGRRGREAAVVVGVGEDEEVGTTLKRRREKKVHEQFS